VPGNGKEPKRSPGFVDLQEGSASLSEYLAKAGRDIGRIGWVSELREQRRNRLSIIVGDRTRKGGRAHFKSME
jgi:hypothetical protein